MFEADARPASEGHQVRQQKTIGRFDLVLVRFRFFLIARAGWMPGEGQRHVQSAPVVPSTAPLLGPGSLGLRGLAVIEEETRITFQSAKERSVREDPRCTDKVTCPLCTS